MKFALSAFLLIHSVAAFARPFPVWGRSSPSSSAAATIVGGDDRASHVNTCLQAAPASVESKPAVIDTNNWELLSPRGQAALAGLIRADEGFGAQTHVYRDWPAAGTDDEGKKRLAEQVSSLTECCRVRPFLS